MKSAWKYPEIVDSVSDFFGYFQIVSYLKQTGDYTLYLMVYYTCVFFLILIILAIFLMKHQIDKNGEGSFSFIISILKLFLQLFQTILFTPLLDLFLSITLCQENSKGVSVHQFFNEIECYDTIHLIQIAIGVIISILFVGMSLTIVLLYYEYRNTLDNPLSKLTGQIDSFFLVFQVIMIILLTSFNDPKYQYILISFQFVFSVFLFEKFHNSSPYYNRNIVKLWSVISAIITWTSFQLCFAKLLEGNLFTGAIYAWFIGIPILVFLIVTQRRFSESLLTLNIAKFDNAELIIRQIAYLQILIKEIHQNINPTSVWILLDGYLECHKQACWKDDCAAKALPQGYEFIEMRKYKKLKLQALQDVMKEIYFFGIKRFSQHSKLRLAYSFFLLENASYKQQAINELQRIQQMKNSEFDTKFIVFRYIKVIEEELSQNRNTGNTDIISELAFQQHQKVFADLIEECSLFHMEFWSQVQEDVPDLDRINVIGQKISSYKILIDQQWEKMGKLNGNMDKTTKLYAKYLLEVVNNNLKGDKQMEKAIELQIKTALTRNRIITSADDIYTDSDPTIVMTTEPEKYCMLSNANQAACYMYSCEKNDLINRHVNHIQPKIVAKVHDKFIKRAIKNNKEGIKMENKERFVYPIDKRGEGYILASYMNISTLQVLNQALQFVAIFRLEKNFRKISYLIVDNKGRIQHLSSGCITFLQIDYDLLQKNDINNIEQLLPGVMKRKKEYMNKLGQQINYNIPQFSKVQNQNQEEDQDDYITLQLTINTIDFPDNNLMKQGLLFRLERCIKEISEKEYEIEAKKITDSQSNYQNNQIFYNFHFNPDLKMHQGRYINAAKDKTFMGNISKLQESMLGEFDEEFQKKQLEIDREIQEEEEKEALLTKKKGALQTTYRFEAMDAEEQQEIRAQKNYGEGFKTTRWFNGRFMEVEDAYDDSSEDEDFLRNQQYNEAESSIDTSITDFSSATKSFKIIEKVVNDKSQSQSMLNLKRIGTFLGVIILSLVFIDYFLTTSQFEVDIKMIELIKLSNMRLASLQSILGNVRDMKFMGIGLFDKIYKTENERQMIVDEWKSELETDIYNLQQIQRNISLSVVQLNEQQKELENEDVVRIYYKNRDDESYYDINEASQQIMNYAHQVISLPYQKISSNDSNVYFLEQNMFNDVYLQMRNGTDLYIESVREVTDTQLQYFSLIAISSGLSMIILIFVLVPIFIIIVRQKQIVLGLLLDIPEKANKYIYQRCENFIIHQQMGEEDEVESFHVGEGNEEEEHVGLRLSKKKRRKYKISQIQSKIFVGTILFVSLIIQSYFMFNFFMNQHLLYKVQSVITELNQTALAEPFYLFIDNVQREYISNPDFKPFGEDPTALTLQNIQQSYQIDATISKEHAINQGLGLTEYNEAFTEIMVRNSCPILGERGGLSGSACEEFAEGTIKQGMTVMITRYFENLRLMQASYNLFNNNPQISFYKNAPAGSVLTDVYKDLDDNGKQQKIISILTCDASFETREIQKKYLSIGFQYIIEKFSDSIQVLINDAQSLRLVLLILSTITILLCYLLIWLPFIQQLAIDARKSRQLLSMIPIQVIVQIPTIRKYLKIYITQLDLLGK